MRYQVRRIGIGSTLRQGLLLGWLVALCPAACVAGVLVQALRSLAGALARVETLDISVLGQQIATVDPLALLQLRGTAATIGQLAQRLPLVFVLLTLLLMLLGTAYVNIGVLLFVAGYNSLARLTGGLEIELRRSGEDRTR